MRNWFSSGVLVWLLFLSADGQVMAQPVPSQTAVDGEAVDRSEAYRLFLRGRHLEGEDDIEGAIRSYREASDIDRTSGEVLAELSALYARRNRGEEAVTAGLESLGRDPSNQSAHRILGLIYAARANERDGTVEDARLGIRHLEQARDTPLPDFHLELTLARLYLVNDGAQKAIGLLEELQKDEPGFGETGFLLAQAYQQVGRTADAITTLERVVESGRPSYRALRSLADLYGRGGRWGDAVETYERAVERNPRSARTKRELANALLKNNQAEEARDVLDELVTLRPNDAAGLYLLSEVELDLGNFAAAENAARRLTELEDGGIRGTLALTEVYSRRRQHRRVVDALEPVLQNAEERGIRPEQLAGLLARIGFAYEQLQDHQAAIRTYEEGVKLIPTSLAFGARLAQTYINAGRLDDARQILQNMQGYHSGSLTLVRLEARLLGDGGDFEAGLEMLRDALQVHGDEPTAHLFMADYYGHYERFEEAIYLLESAESQFPNDTSVLFQLGALLEQSDRHADAEQAFRRLLERDPEHGATLNYLGYMLADGGDRLEESVRLLERAIKIDPHNGAYLDSLGWAYFKLDRLDLAEMMLQQASEQMAWNSVIQDHFGDLMLKLERYREAIAAWERALAGDGDEVERENIEQKIGDAKRQLGR
jgi:tetratricopeptide (TPR) repeat protein